MNYIFKNDLQVLKIIVKLILLYCFFLIFSIYIFSNFEFNNTNIDNYTTVLGLSLNLKDTASICFFVFNIIFTIYLTISLFTRDIMLGNLNLFLRISIKKWLTYKLLLLLLFIILIKAIFHILTASFCYVMPIYLWIDILVSTIISLTTILILLFTKRFYFIIAMIASIFYVVCYYQITIVKCLNFNYYIVLIIIIEIIAVFLFHKQILKLFNLGGNV